MEGRWATLTELGFILRDDGGLEFYGRNGNEEKWMDLRGIWVLNEYVLVTD